MKLDPQLIQQIFTIVLIPLLGILTRFVVVYLSAKCDELQSRTDNEKAKKYMSMITDTITRCVITTNQTYVDALKEQGAFDEAAQKTAFQKTLNAVLAILTDDTKNYIKEITDDMEEYLIQLIESEVNKNKLVVASE